MTAELLSPAVVRTVGASWTLLPAGIALAAPGWEEALPRVSQQIDRSAQLRRQLDLARRHLPPTAEGDDRAAEVAEALAAVWRASETQEVSSSALQCRETLLITNGEPFSLFGGLDDWWVRLRVGAWRGYARLPQTWLTFAYATLGGAPPALDASGRTETRVGSELDRAVTGFALGRAAALLAARWGRLVEVGLPLRGGQLPFAGDRTNENGEKGWVCAFFDWDLGGRRRELVLTWPVSAEPPPPALEASWLGGLPVAVSVIAGSAQLPLTDLARLELGDILIPDRWLPQGLPDPTGAQDPRPVLLSFHRRQREAVVMAGEEGLRLVLRSSEWKSVPEGAVMLAEPHAPHPEPPPTEAAPPEANLPDEIEVSLAFELDRLTVPLGELLTHWREGATVALSRTVGDPVRILLHHAGGYRQLGLGRVVLLDERLGIRIDQWRPQGSEDRR